jgi:hypothetical protein
MRTALRVKFPDKQGKIQETLPIRCVFAASPRTKVSVSDGLFPEIPQFFSFDAKRDFGPE